jgi:protein O-GlcNAc transferase
MISPDLAGPAGREAFEIASQHYEAGSLAEAEAACRHILRSQPNDPDALHLLALIAHQAGRHGIAMALVRKAIALDPSVPTYYNTLGLALLSQCKPTAAEASFRQALDIAPDDANTHLNRGSALIALGRVIEAEASFRQALTLKLAFLAAHSNLLFLMHYLPTCGREVLFAAGTDWGDRYATPLVGTNLPHVNVRDPERRLRVGYVSADLHHHPVGHVLAAVLASHDKDQLETYCYNNNRYADHITARIFASADHWRNIKGIDDREVAAMIRADGIDVLVDLSGHTSGHRLLVFARKPAPIQATWLGYFDTTGLPAMDYIIADRFVCPEGDERFYTERILRLPDAFLCYVPPECVNMAPAPALSRGYVTFGCFNNIAKITPEVVALWGQICRAVPTARVCLKSAAFADAGVAERYRAMFATHGVSAERVLLSTRSSYSDYLVAHNDVDIALDPFPYNGGATTCAALWMGVPVVALTGDRFVSRMGMSLLSAANCREFIAESPERYVEKAVALASDPDHLASVRAELRQRVIGSPLCDETRFTRGLEAAYRRMWRDWCRLPMSCT